MNNTEKQLRELAKQAYNSNDVCQTLKDKISEILPELKPQLEVGKWYKRDIELLVWNDGNYTYGFNRNGVYGEQYAFTDTDGIRLATKEEVQSALIKEAKKRGFKVGVRFECLKGFTSKKHSQWIDEEIIFEYQENDNLLYALGLNQYDLIIFDNGKWAEIIDQPKERHIIIDDVKYKLTKAED